MDYEKLMKAARKHNGTFDKIDHQHGNTTPSQIALSSHIATAMEAIKAGIMLDDWSCVCEGQSMLEDVMRRLGTEFEVKR